MALVSGIRSLSRYPGPNLRFGAQGIRGGPTSEMARKQRRLNGQDGASEHEYSVPTCTGTTTTCTLVQQASSIYLYCLA